MFPIRGVPGWNYSGDLQYVDHATAAKVHSRRDRGSCGEESEGAVASCGRACEVAAFE